MVGNKKGELINGAYSKLRISGLTVSATADDTQLALSKLETFAHELFSRNVCLGYNLEDEPDTNSLHNVPRKFWDALQSCLAVRMLPDFGKGMSDKVDPMLVRQGSAALSFLHSSTAVVPVVDYPSRAPIGSGNRWRSRYQRFHRAIEQAPVSCETNTMYENDVDNFVEHFDAWLNDGESIASYTLTNDVGLQIVSESNATPDINYQVKAIGNGLNFIPMQQVKIVVTTSDSRIETRIINFTILITDVP